MQQFNKPLLVVVLCTLVLSAAAQNISQYAASFDTSEVCFQCKTLEEVKKFEAKKGSQQKEREYNGGTDDTELVSTRWDNKAGMFVESTYQFNNSKLSLEVVWTSCALDSNTDNSFDNHYDTIQCKNENFVDYINKYEAIKKHFKMQIIKGDIVLKTESDNGDDIPTSLSFDAICQNGLLLSISVAAKDILGEKKPYLLRLKYSY